jgi:hypothetical protein
LFLNNAMASFLKSISLFSGSRGFATKGHAGGWIRPGTAYLTGRIRGFNQARRILQPRSPWIQPGAAADSTVRGSQKLCQIA